MASSKGAVLTAMAGFKVMLTYEETQRLLLATFSPLEEITRGDWLEGDALLKVYRSEFDPWLGDIPDDEMAQATIHEAHMMRELRAAIRIAERRSIRSLDPPLWCDHYMIQFLQESGVCTETETRAIYPLCLRAYLRLWHCGQEPTAEFSLFATSFRLLARRLFAVGQQEAVLSVWVHMDDASFAADGLLWWFCMDDATLVSRSIVRGLVERYGHDFVERGLLDPLDVIAGGSERGVLRWARTLLRHSNISHRFCPNEVNDEHTLASESSFRLSGELVDTLGDAVRMISNVTGDHLRRRITLLCGA